MKAPHPLAPELRAVNARDLAWLIASLVVVIAPHALRAPWWLTLLTLCLYGWRMYFALNRAPLPSRLSLEQQLSRLAGWVLAAERSGAHYGLRLPGVEIAPSRGDVHRAACLQALALYA